MYVDSLELMNYRNYNTLNITFDKGTTILYGDNAQGKTNILEAIYLSATTKSHRGSKDKEIIRFGDEEAHIRIHIIKHDVGHKIDLHLRKNKNKGVAIDGNKIKRSGELFGIMNIIFFSPEDLNLIKNGPSERRRFIDLELCQLNKLYHYNYMHYHKALGQRNLLLKQIHNKSELIDTLDIWDYHLKEYGKNIIKFREEFIMMLNEIIKDIHGHLTGKKETLKVIYEKNVSLEDYDAILKNKRKLDLKYQTTQTGPHRDDICFLINGIDTRKFGSQGQQRTAALSLKLAEIELVKKIAKDNPVLLLDDVMSELDNNRKQYLLKSIHDIQTIITCTGYDDFMNKAKKNTFMVDAVYSVKEGQVSKK